jgi:hypothetical protein
VFVASFETPRCARLLRMRFGVERLGRRLEMNERRAP